MDNYRCKVCGYVYEPAEGDASQHVTPNTPFESLPDDWLCPECGADQAEFEMVDECDRPVQDVI